MKRPKKRRTSAKETPPLVAHTPRQKPTFTARALFHLVNYAAQRGLARDALLAHIGVAADILTGPDLRIATSSYYAAMEYAAAELADPFFGQRFVEATGFSSSGALGFLAMASNTVGESIERFVRYHRYLDDSTELTLARDDRGVTIACQTGGPNVPGQLQTTETYAMGFLQIARGRAPIPMLRFRHAPRPGTTIEEYAHFYGCVPQFGAARDEWTLPAAVLAWPLIHANPSLVSFFESYLQRELQGNALAIRTDLVQAVRETIANHVGTPALSLEEAARRLGTAPRSLQRRLAEEGHSFQQLLSDVRYAQARAYLGSNLPIAEISYLLGYSDPSVFHRLFAKWSGTTPSEWRKREMQRALTR